MLHLKLYIPSTINIWKKVLTKAIWADKKWAGFWQISMYVREHILNLTSLVATLEVVYRISFIVA